MQRLYPIVSTQSDTMRSVVATAVFLATASAWTPQSRYKGKQMHSYLLETCSSPTQAAG